MMIKKRILCCKGGGIRGAYTTARYLVRMEQQLGKPLRTVFEMFTGTSTGALIAAALSRGIPATQILEIYAKRSAEIFPSPALASVRQLARGYAYESANIGKVLLSEFGSDCALNDLPARIMLTARSVGNRSWYFVQDNPRNAQTTGKLSLIECATASAAAPWYFDAQYVHPTGGALIGWCFDGGVGGNANPVYETCVEAFEFDTFQPGETLVISLGTGFYPDTQPNPPKGALQTISWITDTLLDAADDFQVEAAHRQWPGVVQAFDGQLPRPVDMADTSSISDLIAWGKQAPADDWLKILQL